MLPWRRCLVVCLFVFAQFIDFGTEWQHCIPTHHVLCQNIRQDDRTTCSGCLLLIKKKTTQKHKNVATTAAQFETIGPRGRAAKPAVKIVDSGEISSSISVLTFKKHRFLRRHCTGLHYALHYYYYFYFVQVMQVHHPPPAAPAAHLSCWRASLSTPTAASHCFFFFFVLPSSQCFAVQTQVRCDCWDISSLVKRHSRLKE